MHLLEKDELAESIDRALKSLPDVPAPSTLGPRVLRFIASGETANKKAAGWESWPLRWRLLSLLALMAHFAAGCAAVWLLFKAVPAAWATLQSYSYVSSALAWVESVRIVCGALVTAARPLTLPVLAGWFAGLSLLVGLLIGLGSFYLRLGFAVQTWRPAPSGASQGGLTIP